MISETTIDRVLSRLEAGSEDYETELGDFAGAQPHLMDYLTNEDTEAFTEVERALLLFAALVIFQSIDEERAVRTTVTGNRIAEIEERNYETLSAARAGSFRGRLDPFFADYPEEDLLAFVEDLTIAEDAEEAISPEEREPFFVTLKTVIDVLSGTPAPDAAPPARGRR